MFKEIVIRYWKEPIEGLPFEDGEITPDVGNTLNSIVERVLDSGCGIQIIPNEKHINVFISEKGFKQS